MKKTILSAFLLCATMAAAQTAEFFKPYVSTDLRLPSVPLVVNDPYFSIWSPFDHLTDGTTAHWTGDDKPLLGLLRVDGTTYRFLGAQERVLTTIAPMADEEAWEADFTTQKPKSGWQKAGFDVTGWEKKKAAFGSKDQNYINTVWEQTGTDIYVRRTINLTASDLASDLYIKYSHDDVFELYVNGTEVANTGETWVNDVVLHIDDKLKKLFHEGENILAAHCHNTTGGAYTDFGLYKNSMPQTDIKVATQKSVDVLATNTYYTFGCGPVELDVVFTAPMLIDDYDLLSMPINYISTQVRSTDGQQHDVQLYLSASPLNAVNKPNQATISSYVFEDGFRAVRTGTVDQPILAKKGDGICIDWGYFYLPAINGQVTVGSPANVIKAFTETGKFPRMEGFRRGGNAGGNGNRGAGARGAAGFDFMRGITARKASEQPTLAYIHDFGRTQQASSFAMMGYDEIEDIEYMYERYKGYWAHGGQVTIADAFKNLQNRYANIMQRCRQFDKTIYDDGMQVGGKQYAEILSASYRHVIAAHKVFQDKDGNVLFFSKENNSNGCVNTVDLTYPEAPLFLLYNPELQKGMMTSIFDYSLSGRWTKPFAAHDLGTYPIANGQVYGGDMPLEEAGNMITLAATLCMLDGNASYVEKYWDMLTTWADYLVENGQDPENQLCTDDFAGHWAHNCNLSLKAICGVAGYALMAQIRGEQDVYERYIGKARQMAQKWEEMALEGDHYRLAFDRKGTWSQKYNMIWDQMWGTKLFSDKVYEREIKYYLKVQNKYGLPLDSRKDYTKSDWIMWTAGMAPDQATFEKFVTPVYNYINETESRVPISDWSDTKTAKMVGFKARSVIGGYWMRVLTEKMKK